MCSLGDNFGSFVGIHDDRAVVGALFEDSNATGLNGDGTDNNATESGAAYIY